MVYCFYRGGFALLVVVGGVDSSLFSLGTADQQRAGVMEVSSETDPGESSPTVEDSWTRVAACNTTEDVQHGFSAEVSRSSINCSARLLTHLRDLWFVVVAATVTAIFVAVHRSEV